MPNELTVLFLRRKGYTFNEIRLLMGVSYQTAKKMYRRALGR